MLDTYQLLLTDSFVEVFNCLRSNRPASLCFESKMSKRKLDDRINKGLF